MEEVFEVQSQESSKDHNYIEAKPKKRSGKKNPKKINMQLNNGIENIFPLPTSTQVETTKNMETGTYLNVEFQTI